MEEGKLLYAIILDRGAEEQGSRGAGEQRGRVSSAPQHLSTSAQEAPPQQCTGIDDAPLETVSYRDLAAVLSAIDPGKFGQEGEERLRADLVRYQQVNLALLQHYTVVPMRFGFTARNREHVEEVLEKTYLQLRTLLNRLTGKVELIVQAFWDLPKVLQEIAAQDEHLVQAKREAACNPQSASAWTFHWPRNPQSIEVGRRLFKAAEARKNELTTVVHASLSLWAMDSSEGPLKTLNHALPLEGGGRGKGCVEHIFNRSYLVEKEYESLFDATIDQLGIRYQSDITFNYIGPLPAYSFTNLEFNQGNFEVIDRARQTLALPEYASLEDIKGAYRRLALTSHPDRHPEDPQAEARFRIVTHAYEVLETYCRSLQNFPGEIPLCSFAREQVERTFTVKEKREACYP
jgi:hypothetical protein